MDYFDLFRFSVYFDCLSSSFSSSFLSFSSLQSLSLSLSREKMKLPLDLCCVGLCKLKSILFVEISLAARVRYLVYSFKCTIKAGHDKKPGISWLELSNYQPTSRARQTIGRVMAPIESPKSLSKTSLEATSSVKQGAIIVATNFPIELNKSSLVFDVCLDCC